MNAFFERIASLQRSRGSRVCVGLDPDPRQIAGDVTAFLAEVVAETCDLVCAYKPNLAFFEALGLDGWHILDRVLAPIRGHVPIIADAKRGDVGHTSAAYARSLFEVLGADAVTVNPYAGFDSVAPYLDYPGRGIYVLARMSNLGAADLQDRRLADGRLVWESVVDLVIEHNQSGALGVVVGATRPQALLALRRDQPDLPVLVPGVGAQGGDARAVARAAEAAPAPLVVSVSRAVLYAPGGPGAARRAVESLITALQPEPAVS